MSVKKRVVFQFDKRSYEAGPPRESAGSEFAAPTGSAIRKLKEDHRPPKGWWADGHYMNRCFQCGENFVGDKRAGQCADCAYKDSPNAKVSGVAADACGSQKEIK